MCNPDCKMFLRISLVIIALSMMNVAHGHNSCPPECQCSKKLTTVNCEGRNLNEVPQGIPDTVERLFLDHNAIYSLNEADFRELPNLKELHLENNKIGTIKPYTFTGDKFPSLGYLDLRNNKLAIVEDHTFSNLTNLGKLYLVNNYIQKINPQAFNGSVSVTYLNLDGNKLTSIPPLGQLKGLQQLYIQANVITNATFPHEYVEVTKLIDIGLSNNKISQLEASAFISLKNAAIVKVELSRNAIHKISKMAFSPLRDIQSLKLGRNPITAVDLEDALAGLQGKPLVSLNIANISLGGLLPNTTFHMLRNTTIKTLVMSNNKIQHLPERGFANLGKLLTLDLSASGLFSVSDTAFDGLDVLTTLLLNDNELSDVPKNMPNTLQYLYLNGNQLTRIPDLAFSNLGNLQKLYLGGNKIVTLKERSFDGLSHLKILHLVGNNIGTLPGELFSSLVRLVSLELNENNLGTIQDDPDQFSSMTSLQYLNLAGNDCKTLPLNLFKPLSSLAYLHLENNLIGPVIQQDLSGTLFDGLTKLVTLELSNNGITTIPDASFKSLTSLQDLKLKSNKISGWGPHLFAMTKTLQSLDLSQNVISLVHQTSVQDFKTLERLNLSGNPFACTCDLRWFRDWMNSTTIQLENKDTYTCNSPKAWRGKPLLSFDRTKINCIFYTKYQIIAAAVSAVVLMLVIFSILYRKRWTVKLGIYRLNKRMKRIGKQQAGYEALNGDNKQFDAYISCTEDDFTWVLQNLLPEVDVGDYQNKPFGGKYRLYFDPRDSEVGKSIFANMIDNIEASRLVIIVLTKNCVLTGKYEFEMEFIVDCKHKRAIEDYIIIKHSDVESKNISKILHNKITRGDYLEWADQEDAKRNVTLKLLDRLAQRQPNQVEEV